MNFYVYTNMVNLLLLVVAIVLCFKCHVKMKSVLGVWFLVGLASAFMFFYVLFGILSYYNGYGTPIDFEGLRYPLFFAVTLLIICAYYIYSREVIPLRRFLERGR